MKPESFVTSVMKFSVIAMLSERPAHGYEMISRLRKLTGRNVSAAQVYPFLKELESRRLVITRPVIRDGRQRKVYSLTAAGRRFSADLLSRFAQLLDMAIRPRLTACAHCGCEVYRGGFAETVGGRRRVFCCRYCAGHS